MSRNPGGKPPQDAFNLGLGGIFKGLGDLVEKLGELAEKQQEIAREGEIKGAGGEVKGMYGFTVRFGGQGGSDIKVEPFGNVRKDTTTGKTVVEEVREPVVDIFEEPDHILVVAEMPGISATDVKTQVAGDLLTISAERGDKKYRKEVLLPREVPAEKIEVAANNGVIEIRCKH